MTKRIFLALSTGILLAGCMGIHASAEPTENTEVTEPIITTHSEQAETEPYTEIETDVTDNTEDLDILNNFMAVMAEAIANGEMTESSENPDGSTQVDYYNDPYYDTQGNASLINNQHIIYNSSEMQFISVTTKDGHVFYVLINYSAENGEDNVYFLNKVDDYDLYSLLYTDENNSDSIQQYESVHTTAAAVTQAHAEETTIIETEASKPDTAIVSDAGDNKGNMTLLLVIAGALVIVGGAAFYVLKIKPGKQKNADDDFALDDDLEINEDDEQMP
ncbi:MAG: CD1107 family mobile element protein [Ruminococcus sp.]